MSNNEKSSLGKGLSALLGGVFPNPISDSQTTDSVMRVRLDQIEANQDQPRTVFEEVALKELSDSIAQQGIISPIIVRPMAENRYQIIAGERRFRAAQIAKFDEVPVIVRNVGDTEAREIALIENIQRADLSAIEEARAYKRFVDLYGATHVGIAAKVGKSRSHVSNLLRILELPQPVADLLNEGKISIGHAKVLVGAPNATEIANKIVEHDLSVRQVEKLLKQNNDKEQAQESRIPLSEHLAGDLNSLQELIQTRLGLKVKFKINDDKSGTMVISYSSLEELDKVLQVLSR